MHVSGRIAYSSSLFSPRQHRHYIVRNWVQLKTSPVANQYMGLTRTTHEIVVRYQLLGTTFPQALYYAVMRLVLWEAIANARYFEG